MQKTQDWENELGTTLERTVKLGKCNKQKSGKLPNQQHIQKLGRGSVQLQKAEKLILPSKLLRSKTGLRKQDSGHGNLFSEQDDDMVRKRIVWMVEYLIFIALGGFDSGFRVEYERLECGQSGGIIRSFV